MLSIHRLLFQVDMGQLGGGCIWELWDGGDAAIQEEDSMSHEPDKFAFACPGR